MTRVVLNFVAFQANWFAVILGAARGWPWLGVVTVLASAAAHAMTAERRRVELALYAIAAAFGYAADSTLVLLGQLSFPDHAWLGGPSPLWMVALWVNLATALALSLRWLIGRPVLAAIVGAVSGPLAYGAGVGLGAAELGSNRTLSLFAIGVTWAICLPALYAIRAALLDRLTLKAAPA